MPRADILVINPNSNPAVDGWARAALAPSRLAVDHRFAARRSPKGRFGIESQRDVEQVTLSAAPAGGAGQRRRRFS